MIDAELHASIAAHIRQYGQLHPGIVVRPGSVRVWQLGNDAALSAVFDYTNGSQPMVEYITWVQSESTRLNVAIRVPPGTNQVAIQQEFKPILDSVRILRRR